MKMSEGLFSPHITVPFHNAFCLRVPGYRPHAEYGISYLGFKVCYCWENAVNFYMRRDKQESSIYKENRQKNGRKGKVW